MHAFYWLLNAASPGFAGTGESRGLVPALGAAGGKIGPSGRTGSRITAADLPALYFTYFQLVLSFMYERSSSIKKNAS